MPVLLEIISLEEIRNKLLTESRIEDEQQKAGYVNGVLDMYNEAKKRQKALIESEKEGKKR